MGRARARRGDGRRSAANRVRCHVVVLLLLVGVACEPQPTPPPLAMARPVPLRHQPVRQAPLVTADLTPDGTDVVTLTRSATQLDLAAPATNTGENLRTVFWPVGAPAVADSSACLTWTAQEGPFVQQGLAFRISASGGDVRAVTVTKNVFYGTFSVFNVHTWDSSTSPTYQQVGQVEVAGLKDGAGQLVSLPWTLCARVVGDVVDLKAWAASEPEPEWGDARSGGQVTLPASGPSTGTTGWYIGHLHAGDRTTYTALRTGREG